MRILWVKVGGLWPVNTGGRLRSFNIIAELSRRNEVTVIGSHRPEERDELAAQLPRCKQVISVPYAAPKRTSFSFALALLRSWFSGMPVDLYKFRIPAVRREVARALNSGDFDLVVADFLVALPNIPETRVPLVHFSHNVEHVIWKRICENDRNPLRRLLLEIEWRKMRRFEAAACRDAELTIAVSDEDRDQLQRLAPEARICSVPTGVDIDYFRPDDSCPQDGPALVFTGSMDWQPNDDAILYFIDAILPAVREKVADVTLTVVGRNPGMALQEAAARAGVEVTGTVEDIRPWVAKAAVYVVPLRIGGGTRLKIFEALAMGKAIVSTTIGAEGLPLQEGEHLLRADDPETFAAQVVRLLRDRQLRQHLGNSGRNLVEEFYSWPRVAEEFESRCRQALPDTAPAIGASAKFSAISQ